MKDKKETSYPHVDVAIIGAGVSGAAIARKLSAYELDVVLLEKEKDVSFGTSKANSGIIHGGFHHDTKYLKARLEIQGNLMFDRLQRELDIPFKRCGILVVALNETQLKQIEYLYAQGAANCAIGIEMCSRERILELEPKLNPDVIGGLYAPGGGIIEPYRLVFSLVESARKNGVTLLTDFKVTASKWENGTHRIFAEDGREIKVSYVINAAGLFADEISKIFDAEEYKIVPRKGEYHLLDRMTKGCPDRVVFPVPTAVSKGMLVIPTVEGTVLVGPTAEEIEDKEDFSTSQEKMDKILDVARKMVPMISEKDVISSFSGLRPALPKGDFYIEISKKTPHFIQVAGIQSPGLTAAPAIGEYVKDLLKRDGCSLTEKRDYDPCIGKVTRIRNLTPYEADAVVKNEPKYGNIICRCEKVSEAEIIEAIHRGHTTLDGIKFFTRSGMGRCQGGFCTYKTIKIIMRETGLSYDQIMKGKKNSFLLKDKL